ncbi:glycoside hydrolase family 97 protein [Parabacteroides pacaensis]|uniref:glycoside hydrolase family 97 protein n=1 Tax=Parabacteroides pacaensis TaxID=2086575 RepID=UPI000D1008F3|nr:glycoside hydrolase family 97 protein [Parabacteroides pacaensis]
MKTPFITLIYLASLVCIPLMAKEVETWSPDKKLKVDVSVEEQVSMAIRKNGQILFEIKDIYMETGQGFIPARNAKVRAIKREKVNRMVIPEIKEKNQQIPEIYNETTILFKNHYALQYRVYNEGIAYRLLTEMDGKLVVYKEHAEFIFDNESTLVYQQDTSMNSDYEAPYIHKKLSELEDKCMGNLPALLQSPQGNVLFLEANLQDYPCMWIRKGDKNLETHFWNYPKEYYTSGNSKNRRRILKCEDYIADTQGSREFPWRVFAIGEEDIDLLNNQLVYLLGSPCRIKDPSWIKPGWVTLDWWSRRGLYNVDFKAGINTETAKYMIDFASAFGIRYFLFDDGWTYKEDLTRTIESLNMKEIVDYATSKNVDVLLWVTYDLLDTQMEKALKQFSNWGIKGIKIDFMNRSDQEVVNFYWKAAEETAKYKMVVDFHGAYRPDGLRRTYPNVLTREALIEFEYSGGTDKDNPDHHCTLPFIRNVAGPMDYIPGTLHNATRNEFRMNHDRPMGQGTRAHAMAMAVITESPMQMLPDPQSDYYKEEECTRFLTQIPVEWDKTIPLQGKVGDYVALARCHGEEWYIGAITDWTPRELEITLDFLEPDREYTMQLFKDGMNADIRAIDYKMETIKIKKGDKIKISMSSGGGWVAKIYR